MITAGRIPPNPSEVLGLKRMLDLVDSLKDDYLVLLDAPPLTPVTGAAILTTRAAGALIVVGTGKTTFEALGQALGSLATVNAVPMGLVTNRVPTRGAGKASYGYRFTLVQHVLVVSLLAGVGTDGRGDLAKWRRRLRAGARLSPERDDGDGPH